MHRFPFALTLLAAALTCGVARAADRAPHTRTRAPSGRVESLVVEPKSVFLTGPSATQTLVCTVVRSDGTAADATAGAAWVSEDPSIATVGKDGVVRAVAIGSTYVRAATGGAEARAFVVVRRSAAGERPFSFSSDIAPVLSHIGCNGSNCHGTLTGQSGFKLSLFGYDPEADYEAIVTKSDGRRIDRDAPQKSLLLLKPTFAVKHGGGMVLDPASEDYRRLRDWVASGATKGTTGPRLLGIEVYPKEPRVLGRRGDTQRLVVVARYSDGSEVDMTRRVRYTSNDPSIAAVSPEGIVKPGRDGETAIMVRTLGAVGVARVGVVLRPPLGAASRLRPATFIDEEILRKLERLRIAPSAAASDAEFLRRVSLDITGTLPIVEEVRRFLSDRSTSKRELAVERLLQSPEYADFWALKWGDLLTNTPQFLYNGTAYFQAWLRDALARNLPFDRFARELLTASGGTYEALPSNFYSIMKKPEEMATFTSQVFLGISLECARCHDHPNENWRRDDFMGLAAFFSQVKFKGGPRNNERFLYIDPDLEFKHPDTKQPVRAKFLGGTWAEFSAGEDRRARFADWLASPSNPYFARAAVNRVWKELMGRGLVDPPDDFRATNPPTHPELLDRLAVEFVAHGFDLRWLIRAICTSRTYQLSALPNDTNRDDKTSYARYALRRLTAEQLLDAIAQVTEVPEQFPFFYPGKRAIQLPDPLVDSYFLTIFDRATRENATCSRKHSTSMTQSLHLASGDAINSKLRSPSGVIARLLDAGRSDAEIVEHFYLAALSREPTADERRIAEEGIRRAAARREGLEDVLWALLDSKEFLYNH